MLNNDLSLSEAVIKELLPYKDNEDYMTHIAVFNAYLRFIQVRPAMENDCIIMLITIKIVLKFV